ncbi:aminotransferase class V-fold PLP-dependent enzyme [Alteromonas sp. ASW11-36]|uniref:cysteine desulfurase n=1 Tax=Alteromonas arenosi TaxID=3055817 RepID=A0ABT7SYK6_9ALTE|nr:aminotransferase class V-fold PLP-dependent enzyme [Alteromonas sp. ASW11-36]MDM7861094.1 aminotransferase class V-fold PLP-dependent enzyme [Alteromonas sp. ASW11-36]
MSIRDHFPYFQQSTGIYADSAATTHKTQAVIERTVEFLTRDYATVHRSAYRAGNNATNKFEATRQKVAAFIGSPSANQIIFTKGATESLNVLATTLGNSELLSGSEILVCGSEHHANLLPWQQLAEKRGLTLKIMPINSAGQLEVERALAMVTPATAIVAIAQVSNALGNEYPIKRFIDAAHAHKALSVIDGTQAVAHMPVDMRELACDFYVFSAHKMYGPTGVGVLYGKAELLDALPPYQLGGEMVAQATFSRASWQSKPLKFEAGTPNIAGVVAFAAAVDFLAKHLKTIQEHEKTLAVNLYRGLKAIEGLRMLGDFGQGISSIPLVSFILDSVHHHDVALLMDKASVAVRSGHHCAMPLMDVLQVSGTTRISLAAYNTVEEVEAIVDALKKALVMEANATVETVSDAELPIATAIRTATGWDAVYRQIMLAGKQLPVLALELRGEATKVVGCEADVWLHKVIQRTGNTAYAAYSPSKIVRGLLAVVLERANSLAPEQQVRFDYHQHLEAIGLQRFLSDSRQNGINAVIQAIKS